MSVWEGGQGEQPEDEREQKWVAPSEETEYEPEDDEAWRGDQHLDWPEYLCGPEYWFYRKWKKEGDDEPGPSR